MTNNISFFLYFSLINRFSILIAMGESERYPISLNAVNVVCFKIDWDERMLNVLLVKRSINPHKNKWSLPGGFVQNDETLEDAARRIFIKETGIAPSYLSQFRTYSSTKRDKRLIKAGYFTKKGKFGFVRKDGSRSKSKKSRKRR